MAYITFPTLELAMHAKSTKNLEYLGTRYIELSEFKWFVFENILFIMSLF